MITKEQKNNYGLTHAALSILFLLPFAITISSTIVVGVVGTLISLWFIKLELDGPGTLLEYPKNYQGPYSNLDRKLDWIFPLLVCIIITGAHGYFGRFIDLI